jgi:hypothetical protein
MDACRRGGLAKTRGIGTTCFRSLELVVVVGVVGLVEEGF